MISDIKTKRTLPKYNVKEAFCTAEMCNVINTKSLVTLFYDDFRLFVLHKLTVGQFFDLAFTFCHRIFFVLIESTFRLRRAHPQH